MRTSTKTHGHHHRFPVSHRLFLRGGTSASATVIGNILMVALTLLLMGIVVIQADRIWENANLPRSIDEALGRDRDPDAVVKYKVYYEEPNLTITITSISKRVEIPRVNYVLYNLSISEKDESGFLVDIKNSNSTKVRYIDFDGDGHFSKADKIIINFGEEEPYGGYLLEFRDNKHPDLVYKIRIKESDFAKV